MRYYTFEYTRELKRQIKALQDSVDSPKYTTGIANTSVPSGKDYLKQDCLTAAYEAQSKMRHIDQRLNDLYDTIDKFYNDVVDSALEVDNAAKKVCYLITEAAAALKRIDDLLRGVGTYQGQDVTAETLAKAGITPDRINTLKETTWLKIIKAERKLDCIHEGVAIAFVNNVLEKLKDNVQLSVNEIDLLDIMVIKYVETIFKGKMADRVLALPTLNDLYSYYASNRYGYFSSATYMDNNTVKACVMLYEILNPSAQQIMNRFFSPVINDKTLDQETVFENMDIIKYELYTNDPALRAVILSHLPELTLQNQPDPKKVASYGGKIIRLHMNEEPDGSAQGFFHEFGHGLDDLLVPGDGYISDRYRDALIADFKDHLTDAVNTFGYRLTDPEKTALIDFMMNKENVNVTVPGNDKYYEKFLPKSWSDDQKTAFATLRNYYGYRDFTFKETGEIEDNDHYGTEIDDSRPYQTVNDMIGAMTHGKVGSFGVAHFLNPKKDLVDGNIREDGTKITSAEGVHEWIVEDSYWNSGNEATEYFAESFDDLSFNVDPAKNKEMFPDVYKQFEEDVNKAISDLN